MGFPDSFCLFFDLIFFVYLLSWSRISCWGRDVWLVPYQRNLGVGFFPGVVGGFLYAIVRAASRICTLNNNRMILKIKK